MIPLLSDMRSSVADIRMPSELDSVKLLVSSAVAVLHQTRKRRGELVRSIRFVQDPDEMVSVPEELEARTSTSMSPASVFGTGGITRLVVELDENAEE